MRSLADLNVIAKVTFGGKLFLRNDKEKRGYKGPLFEARPCDLIISKIRVGQGSFCIIGDDVDHVAVSPEYPVYTPDRKKIDPEYLALVLRTPEFLAQLTGSASGNTTKRRIRPAFFESLQIPLPAMGEQRAIVAAYRDTLAKAADFDQKAAETEAKAIEAFETALGLGPQAPLPDRPIFVASFKDIDRWSHEGILRRLVEGASTHSSFHPVVQLRDVIADLENGWSPKCHDRPAANDEWGVLKLGAVSFGVFDQNQNKALPKHLKPKPHLEVKAGQVLISRANITRLVGATAVIGKTREKLILCDKIFRVVPSSSSPVDLVFLAEVLRISDVRRQIESGVTGTSPTMKNISKPALMSLTFPLPPIHDQIDIRNNLISARKLAWAQRKQAQELRTKAWANFKAAVYAADDTASSA